MSSENKNIHKRKKKSKSGPLQEKATAKGPTSAKGLKSASSELSAPNHLSKPQKTKSKATPKSVIPKTVARMARLFAKSAEIEVNRDIEKELP